MTKPLHHYGRVLPDWRLDPPDDFDPPAATDPLPEPDYEELTEAGYRTLPRRYRDV